MERAGFERVRRIDGVFFQPLIVGVRPGSAPLGSVARNRPNA